MSEVYTPGTAIHDDIVIRKVRRLVVEGQVLVKAGQQVSSDSLVATADRPGKLATIRVVQQLGIEPGSIEKVMIVQPGGAVTANEVIAEHKTFFGLLTWRVRTPVEGTVEMISKVSGHVGIRQPSERIELRAYLPGKVVEVMPGQGAVIECRSAMVQGLFGIGGERGGALRILDKPVGSLGSEFRNTILAINWAPDAAWLKMAAAAGVEGVACPTMDDHEITRLLGYEIGVAITGDEQCGLTVVLTEGFGKMLVAPRTWELLKSLEGRQALISGATQVRAGVIRPEVLVPHDASQASKAPAAPVQRQEFPRVRALRAPFFGMTGQIVDSPVEPQFVETGARLRVFKVKLDDGREVVIPRANVEVLG